MKQKHFTKAQENAPHRFAAVAVLILFLGAFTQLHASAANIFLTQTGSGAQTGADCSNAKPISFINNGANYGGGAGQIGPDTVLHACTGTFNSEWDPAGDGTPGHPITMFFEPGAKWLVPVITGDQAWYLAGRHDWVFDGGTPCGTQGSVCNGQLGTTDNGSPGHFTNHLPQTGVFINGASNLEFKNIQFGPFYQNVVPNDTTNLQEDTHGCFYGNNPGAHISIHDSQLHDIPWCLNWAVTNQVNQDVQIYNFDIYNSSHGLYFANSGGTSGGLVMRDGTISGPANWDTTGCIYHHDGVHVAPNPGGAGVIQDVYFYNLQFNGDWGHCNTSPLFLEDHEERTANINNFAVYNSVFTNSSTNFTWNNGVNLLGHSGGHVYNNTVICAAQGGIGLQAGGQNLDSRNNLVTGCSIEWNTGNEPTTLSFLNNEVYANLIHNGNPAFIFNGTGTADANTLAQQFTQWRGIVGGSFESASVTGNTANLNSQGIPQTGSIALGVGANLTASCTGQFVELCSDTSLGGTRVPNARPNAAWTAGAFNGNGAAAPAVCISPSPVTFPSTVQFNNSAPVGVTLTNCGTANLVFNNPPLSVSGTNGTDFVDTLTGNCGGLSTVVPSASCTAQITFRPKTSGPTETAILSVNSNAPPAQVTLNGSVTQPATPIASVTPNPVLFGNQVVGTPSGVHSVHVANTGNADLILGPSFLGFSIADYAAGAGTTCTNNETIHPTDPGCNVGVVFTPAAGGNRNATLTISGNVNGTTSLQGVGTSPAVAAYTLTPATFDFGNVRKGTVSALHNWTVTSTGAADLIPSNPYFTISGGTNPGDFKRVSPGGADCIPAHHYTTGQTCLLSIAVTPSTAGAESAGLIINANVSGPSATMTATGIFPALTVTPPGTLNFGNINVGSSSSPLTVTVSNTGTDTEHLAATALTITGNFSISATNCNNSGTIAAPGNCTVSIIATPGGAGTRTGVLTVHGDVNATVNLSVVGIAAAPIINITPRPVQFIATNVGSTSVIAVATVTNSGTATENISGTVIGNTSEFSVVAGGNCGSTLLAAHSCFYNLTFHPTGTGLRTGTFTVNGTVNNTVALNGDGVAVGPAPAPLPFLLGLTLPAGQLQCVKTGGRCNPIALQVAGQNFVSTTTLTLDGAAIPTVCTSVSCTATLPASTVSLPGFGTTAHTIAVQ